MRPATGTLSPRSQRDCGVISPCKLTDPRTSPRLDMETPALEPPPGACAQHAERASARQFRSEFREPTQAQAERLLPEMSQL